LGKSRAIDVHNDIGPTYKVWVNTCHIEKTAFFWGEAPYVGVYAQNREACFARRGPFNSIVRCKDISFDGLKGDSNIAE
jgi:hypothetical protein